MIIVSFLHIIITKSLSLATPSLTEVDLMDLALLTRGRKRAEMVKIGVFLVLLILYIHITFGDIGSMVKRVMPVLCWSKHS